MLCRDDESSSSVVATVAVTAFTTQLSSADGKSHLSAECTAGAIQTYLVYGRAGQLQLAVCCTLSTTILAADAFLGRSIELQAVAAGM